MSRSSGAVGGRWVQAVAGGGAVWVGGRCGDGGVCGQVFGHCWAGGVALARSGLQVRWNPEPGAAAKFCKLRDTPSGHISDQTCPKTWDELQDSWAAARPEAAVGSPGVLVSKARG